jgi:prolycopene isomerase
MKMPKRKFDVIVIGAGPGGSSCAALLAKRGLNVLLIEKNARAGGKSIVLKKNGYTYDMWPITGAPVFGSRFEQLQEALGLNSGLVNRPGAVQGAFYYIDQNGSHRRTTRPFPQPLDPNKPPEQDQAAFLEMMRFLGIKEDEFESIIRFEAGKAALTDEQVEELDDVSYHDYLLRSGVPSAFYSFSANFANVAYVAPIDQVAASEFIRTERDYLKNGLGYYSEGGFGRLFERCVDVFQEMGGAVTFRARAENILVEDGQIKGVVTDKGTFHAPIVVSNAGIQPTVLKLVGQEYFDSSYVNRVKDLVPSLGLMGTRYFLDKPLLEEAVSIVFSDNSCWNTERRQKANAGEVPEELPVFCVTPSNYDLNLAPPGKQCVLSSTFCPPDPNFEQNETYWNKLDEMMALVWPGFHGHVEFKERYGTREVSNLSRDQVLSGIGGECIGLAQIVGQCGKHKPDAAAPIPGLFYVGCDAGGYGVGTHQAVDSAFNVSELIELYHETH